MPIGKNAIKRVSNGGYSNVQTSAPDMENSTIAKAEEVPKAQAPKVEAPKIEAPATTPEVAPKKTAPKKTAKKPVKNNLLFLFTNVSVIIYLLFFWRDL